MLFVLSCWDKPGAQALRAATRDAHLAFVAASGAMVKAAGPYLDAGGAMIGSMFVVDAPDEEDVLAWHARDPYAAAGLFARVELTRWRWIVGAPAGT